MKNNPEFNNNNIAHNVNPSANDNNTLHLINNLKPLQDAVQNGNVSVVESLLKNKEILESLKNKKIQRMKKLTQGNDGCFLHYAALGKTKEYTEILHCLLKLEMLDINEYYIMNYHAFDNKPEDFKVTPLHVAILSANVNSIKLLREYQADPNLPQYIISNNNMVSSVSLSIFSLDVMVELLKFKNLQLTELYYDKFGGPLNLILTKILEQNNEALFLSAMSLLLSSQTKDNQLNPHEKGMTLLVAAKNNCEKVIDLLLQHSPNKLYCDRITNASAFNLAAEKGNVNLMHKFIKAGWDINNRFNKDKVTSLLFAINQGHGDVVDALLKENADLSICSYPNISVISAIILSPKKNQSIFEKVLFAASQKLDPKLYLLYKNQAFAEAPHCPASDEKQVLIFMQQLYKSGVDIDAISKACNKTALMHACECDHALIVAWLISIHANINLVTKKCEWPALFFAFHARNKTISELLIKAGSDQSFITKNKMTVARLLAKEQNNTLLPDDLTSLLFRRFINNFPNHTHPDIRKLPQHTFLLICQLCDIGAQINSAGDLIIHTNMLELSKKYKMFICKNTFPKKILIKHALFADVLEKFKKVELKNCFSMKGDNYYYPIPMVHDHFFVFSESWQNMQLHNQKITENLKQNKEIDLYLLSILNAMQQLDRLINNEHNVMQIDKDITFYIDEIQKILSDSNEELLNKTFLNAKKEKQKLNHLESIKRRFAISDKLRQDSIKLYNEIIHLKKLYEEQILKNKEYTLAHLKHNNFTPAKELSEHLNKILFTIKEDCQKLNTVRTESENYYHIAKEQNKEIMSATKALVAEESKLHKELEESLKLIKQKQQEEILRRQKLKELAEQQNKEKLEREKQKQRWKTELEQLRKEKEKEKEKENKKYPQVRLQTTNSSIKPSGELKVFSPILHAQKINNHKPKNLLLRNFIAWPTILQEGVDKECDMLQKILSELNYSDTSIKVQTEDIQVERYALLGLCARIMEHIKRKKLYHIIALDVAEKFRNNIFHADNLFPDIQNTNLKENIEINSQIKDLALKILQFIQAKNPIKTESLKQVLQTKICTQILDYKIIDPTAIACQTILNKFENVLKQLENYKNSEQYYSKRSVTNIAIGFIYAQLGCFATILKIKDYKRYQILCNQNKEYEKYRIIGKNYRHVRTASSKENLPAANDKNFTL